MQNYHLKLVTNILVIFMSLLFLIKIFDIGIISDYTKTYSHSGNAILNERSFFENLNYELKLYYLDLGFIRLVKIVQHILGNFNSIFIFKSLHFIIYITLFIQIYFLFKKYLSASFALLSLILFLGLSQVTEYLDPFVAWPEAYALSVVIGLINIALFLKIIFTL